MMLEELLHLGWELLLAGGATTCFAVMLGVPKREYLSCGLVGALGWVVYTLLVDQGQGPALAALVASIPLTALARTFSIWHKAPVTIFLISGIFPLVPGAGIYYTAYYFIMNDPRLSAKGLETLQVALALALGMTIVLGMPLPRRLMASKMKSPKEAAARKSS